MRFIDEYRDAKAARRYAEAIARQATKSWTIMEVCGGQTHAIVRFGVDELLPQNMALTMVGFEPLDILQGIYMCVQQLEQGRAQVENQYRRATRRQGNQLAQQLIHQIFRVIPRQWRGIGEVPHSGLGLREPYAKFDAEQRFGVADHLRPASSLCMSGLIMQGIKKPHDCPAFATSCTPERPLGATMVSSEGACAAYYRYRRF